MNAECNPPEIVMDATPSVLLADTDADSRESLVNHLLLAGVTRIGVAASPEEVTRELSRAGFDLLLVDYELFRTLNGARTLGSHRSSHGSRVVLMVDDDRDALINEVMRGSDIFLCIPKSAATRMLRSIVAG